MAEILENTSNRFVMAISGRFRTMVLSYLTLSSIIAALFGGLGFWIGSMRVANGMLTTLICHHIEPAQVDCVLTERSVDNRISTTLLPNIRGAKATRDEGIDDEGDTYYQCYVRIIDGQGALYPIPLEQFDYRSSYNCNDAIQLADQINRFVDAPQLRFSTYQEDRRVSPLLPWILVGVTVSVSFTLFFMLPILFFREQLWEIDRTWRKLIYTQRRLWKSNVVHYTFREIDHLLVEISVDSDDDKYQAVKLVLKSNEVITIIPRAMRTSWHLKNCNHLISAMAAIAGITATKKYIS